MSKLKLMTIVGTRPEIIKLSEIIKRCDDCFDHTLVHTGQNYDYTLNEVFFKDLSLRAPAFFLGVVGENLGETIGNVISKSYDLFVSRRPDALLLLGDTNSALCVISAKRLKIPVFHLEAGNRCFDENLPEEQNRRVVDHLSDVNLPYSEPARRNLLAEGLHPRFTFAVGSPMAEVLRANREGIEKSDAPARLGLLPGEYILLSAHREENIDHDAHFRSLMDSINDLAETYQKPVIYSVHPRSAKKIEKAGVVFHPLVRAMQPFGFHDYVALEKSALCVVSDSGTLAEESSLLGFPAVSVRTSTERQEAFEKGNFIIGGVIGGHVKQAVALAVRLHQSGCKGTPVVEYADETASEKVVRIIQSYTHIVDRVVWQKE